MKDSTINKEFEFASFKVQNTGKFRIFRILQTGPNKLEGSADWQHVLVCGGFHLYGTLHEEVEKEEE